MSSITINVTTKPGKPAIAVSLPPSASTVELYKEVAAKSKKSIHRIKIRTADKKVSVDNNPKQTLAQAGLKDGDSFVLRDLGPQVSWRTVYLVEYLGPLFIHPFFFYYGHDYLYKHLPAGWNSSTSFRHSKMQIMVYGMVMAHFIKRELETIFVHRFSSATMPLFNLPRNSAYYWGLAGLLLAPSLYGPWYSAAALPRNKFLRSTDEFLYPMLGTWLCMQVCNCVCHVMLRNIRPSDNLKKREIPTGFAFNKITCPNYFFESLGWLVVLVMTQDPAALLFWIAGNYFMVPWATARHRRYKREFGDKYPKRWIMYPGIY